MRGLRDPRVTSTSPPILGSETFGSELPTLKGGGQEGKVGWVTQDTDDEDVFGCWR